MGKTRKRISIPAGRCIAFVILLLLAACQSNPQGNPADRAPNTPTPAIPAPTNTVPALEPTTETPTESPPEPVNLQVYRIIPDESETRFYVDELLFGNPKTVIGRTRDLSGVIRLDMVAPGATEVGMIEINALDLTTDDSFRNRALRSQILGSNKDEFQYIFFEPMAIEGLPENVTYGEPVELSMTGELTIRDISGPVTFMLVVTPVSEREISGSGSAIVLRETYGLEIPNVTGVAEVSQEVRLEFDFVARAE